jgi:hypothetical protein
MRIGRGTGDELDLKPQAQAIRAERLLYRRFPEAQWHSEVDSSLRLKSIAKIRLEEDSTQELAMGDCKEATTPALKSAAKAE